MEYSTKQLIFTALMGALMFSLSFILGSGLNILINPAASGFTSALIQPILITIAALTLRRFGIATTMYLVYGFLAIPTNMVGGLPAPFKILIVLLMGITFDIFIHFGKYKKISFYLGSIVMQVITVVALVYFYVLLGIPNSEKFIAAAPLFAIIGIIESFIGILIGMWIYNKIKNKNIVRQLQN